PESRSRTASWPISTTVSGAVGPGGSEFFKSHRKKTSSDCSSRGSRRKRTPSSRTTSMSQMAGRGIAAEVKRGRWRVTREKSLVPQLFAQLEHAPDRGFGAFAQGLGQCDLRLHVQKRG